jgi:hypothetical protein
MAVPKNTYATYDSIGNREDLADAIYDISPIDTPVLSSIARVRATGIKHEWQTDNLAAATVQGAAEGDDFAASARVQTVRLDNQTQIFRKDISVSRTQRVVLTAGRRDEYAYQLAKGGKELKRNIEKTILGTQGKAVGGTTTARLSGGLLTYIHRTTFVAHNMHATNTITWNGHGATLVGTVTLTGCTAGIIKALLDTVIGVLWDHGSDANVIICNKGQKQGISNITGIATLYREVPSGNQGAIVGGADLYVSDFGEFVVVPDRFTDATNHTIYVTDYEYLAFAELDPIDVIPVAKTGDSDKAMIVCEACLEVRSTDAHGAVFAEYSA